MQKVGDQNSNNDFICWWESLPECLGFDRLGSLIEYYWIGFVRLLYAPAQLRTACVYEEGGKLTEGIRVIATHFMDYTDFTQSVGRLHKTVPKSSLPMQKKDTYRAANDFKVL